MTVTSEISKVIADGDASATVFSFSPMVIQDPSHLRVILVESDGTQTDLSLTTHYTISVSEYPGTGSITYPVAGSPLAADESLIMMREVPITQTVDLENQGGYFPDTQEQALDKLTMICQEMREILDRAIRVVPTVLSTVSLELPEPEAGKFIAWNADANALVNTDQEAGLVGPQGEQGPPGPGTGDMLAANNLSDVADAATARTNLSVYSQAQVDSAVLNAVPVGCIMMWADAAVPSGWLMCNGDAVLRASYPSLFTLIGTDYGAGDGVTTFNVPDMRGRFPMGVGQGNTAEGGGAGTNRTLAATGGKETHTLTTNEMPLHGHPFRASYSTQSTARSATTGGLMTYTSGVSSQPAFTGAVANNQGQQIGGSGGGTAHTIVGPFLALNFIIRAA